ncbi:MAG TPA: class I SAM-dependent methyltransferase [Longimicrobiaceae bacterium]|nr:class I SAM-dependent methyltransferase [Longimicrobiaceae bacterium]
MKPIPVQDAPGAAVPAPPTRRRPDRGSRAAQAVFLELLDKHLSHGALRLIVDGAPVVVGAAEGAESVPTLRVHDPRFFRRVLGEGNLGLGEAYMDGDWTMEEGEVHDFLAILLRNRIDRKVRADPATAWKVFKVQAANLLRGRQWGHVQQHYDLGDDLFESFLDSTLTYSCGYARTPGDSPDELQFNKLDRICQKLELRPGDRLLDIGCGFGGLLVHAATHYGATGMGITTSQRHHEHGNERIRSAGVGDRVRIELRDHRSIEGEFDRVVSVGMMEHLPRKEYGRYFARIAAVLPPHGIGLVHAVGCNGQRNEHDPFTQKYIFPGSGQPRLSEMTAGCERHGLAIRDVENLIRHYGYTAHGWLESFRANQHRLDPVRYDARFRRMWEYYLSCAVAAASYSDAALYQVLFMKDYAGPMPLHRV